MNKIDLKQYNINTPVKKIIEACQQVKDTSETSEMREISLNYLVNLLHLKQQRKLLEEQNKFNMSLIETNKKLVKATWALAIATGILVLVTIFINYYFG